jgi:hypothetical protein
MATPTPAMSKLVIVLMGNPLRGLLILEMVLMGQPYMGIPTPAMPKLVIIVMDNHNRGPIHS